mgnify:CR=1 FL=1
MCERMYQDDQEKIFLQESAKTYWEGIRWGIPAKSAVYYENPLVRARWENNPTLPYARVTEVNILHIEIQKTNTINTLETKTHSMEDTLLQFNP